MTYEQELEENAGVGGRKDILPVKSLSSETGPNINISALVCTALQEAIYCAEDYVRQCEDDSSLDSEQSL